MNCLSSLSIGKNCLSHPIITGTRITFYFAYFFLNLGSMMGVTIIEQCGIEAVRKLRLQKLQNGRPFIINSRDLPPSQCYLEYPDGEIVLAALPNHAKDFNII